LTCPNSTLPHYYNTSTAPSGRSLNITETSPPPELATLIFPPLSSSSLGRLCFLCDAIINSKVPPFAFLSLLQLGESLNLSLISGHAPAHFPLRGPNKRVRWLRVQPDSRLNKGSSLALPFRVAIVLLGGPRLSTRPFSFADFVLGGLPNLPRFDSLPPVISLPWRTLAPDSGRTSQPIAPRVSAATFPFDRCLRLWCESLLFVCDVHVWQQVACARESFRVLRTDPPLTPPQVEARPLSLTLRSWVLIS